MSLLLTISPGDSEGVKWAKLQRLFRAMADNAGISYSLVYPLTDIQLGDSEGVKWQKLGAWAKLIADNIGGGGGGVASVNGQTGVVVLNAADVGAAPADMGSIITKAGVLTGLVTNTYKTVGSILLPAGVWEVWAEPLQFHMDGGDALVTYMDASISLVNNTGDYTQEYKSLSLSAPIPLVEFDSLEPRAFLTLLAPTTVYAVAFALFTANTVDVFANMFARKIPSVTVQL